MVEAAGGVVWRRGPDDAVEVLVVHRPRYDDWSFPKGKLDDGETHEAAAAREVAEETGCTCRIGVELPATHYRDQRDRPKRVRWWLMEPVDGEISTVGAPDEVDEVRWVRIDEVAPLLTYEFDRSVLRAAAAILAEHGR